MGAAESGGIEVRGTPNASCQWRWSPSIGPRSASGNASEGTDMRRNYAARASGATAPAKSPMPEDDQLSAERLGLLEDREGDITWVAVHGRHAASG